MVKRGCSLAMFSLLFTAACAAPTTTTRPSAWPDGPLYDPAGEWAADHEAPAALPPEPRRIVAFANEDESEPDYDLGAFSAGQVERIARVQPVVRAAARAHDVAPDLVNGIIWVESKFQVQARSSKGADGLMQLMPSTGREVARELGRRYSPYDPEFNIHAGTYYFAHLVRRFDGNLRLALAAYNIGPGVVDGWVHFSAPMPRHSRAYVAHVLVAARKFRALAD